MRSWKNVKIPDARGGPGIVRRRRLLRGGPVTGLGVFQLVAFVRVHPYHRSYSTTLINQATFSRFGKKCCRTGKIQWVHFRVMRWGPSVIPTISYTYQILPRCIHLLHQHSLSPSCSSSCSLQPPRSPHPRHSSPCAGTAPRPSTLLFELCDCRENPPSPDPCLFSLTPNSPKAAASPPPIFGAPPIDAIHATSRDRARRHHWRSPRN